MKRDLIELSDRSYDLLVVGGGIHGVCAAWEATRRGLAVCLLEKGDFGEATSANSLRIIHGGLRYLQHADLERIRESARERAYLARIGPHLTRSIPFVIPTYGHGLRGREVMAVAMRVHAMLASHATAPLPPGRTVSARECMELIPGVEPAGLTGGAVWYETHAHDTERLLLTFLRGAVRNGAAAANYAEVTHLLSRRHDVWSVRVQDTQTGQVFGVKAKLVLNAAGPWVNAVLARSSNPAVPPVATFAKAINLVTHRLLPDRAISIPFRTAFHDQDAVLNKGVRHFFVVPWGDYSLIGTRHIPWRGEPKDFAITEDEVERFVAEVHESYPIAPLQREHVLSVQGGMVPIAERDGADVQQLKHPVFVDHQERDGIAGLISLVGVKWTTARAVAEEAVKRCAARLGHSRAPSADLAPVMNGATTADPTSYEEAAVRDRHASLDEAAVRHLVQTYGGEYRDVVAYLAGNPERFRPVAAGSPILKGEVTRAVHEEMALRLTDVLFRRTRLGRAGDPGDEVVRVCAELMARELGWSRDEIERERTEVREALARRHARPAGQGATWRLPS